MSNVRPFMYHYSWDYYKSLIKTAVASAVVIGFVTPFVAFIGALCGLERGGWTALWVVLILAVLSPLFASGWQIYQARKREMFVQSQVSLLGYSVYKVLSCERCTETREFNDYTYEATFYKTVLKCLKDNHTTNLESGVACRVNSYIRYVNIHGEDYFEQYDGSPVYSEICPPLQ